MVRLGVVRLETDRQPVLLDCLRRAAVSLQGCS
jgi:hypothetical protein